jgi:secondary thiamine-phosphate synthase enzyme
VTARQSTSPERDRIPPGLRLRVRFVVESASSYGDGKARQKVRSREEQPHERDEVAMATFTHRIRLSTQGDNDVHDITGAVSKAVDSSGIINGSVTVFVPGSTAGITAIEHESGMIRDLQEFLDRLAPKQGRYHHNHGGDSNGHAHVRSAFIGPSLAVPLIDGRLGLGTWQQIVLVDFDDRPRKREVTVQIVGE